MQNQCEIYRTNNSSHFLSAKCLDSLSGETYKYLKCNNCGFVFLRSEDANMSQDVYTESGYYSRAQHKFQILINGITSVFYKWRYRVISSNFNKGNGLILDVGCGKGRFLVEAKKHGWKTFGIEPTSRSFEIAKGYGLDVIDKPLSEDLFTSKMFDVITLWHVFEHIPNPVNVLSILNAWLKDDGMLVIAVPNIESLQAKFGKDVWFNLDPPRHLYHFSPKTLTLILEAKGYRIEKILHSYPELNLFSIMQTFLNRIGCSPNIIFNYLKNNKKGLPGKRSSLILNLVFSVSLLLIFGFPLISICYLEQLFKRGGSIVVLARKKV